VIILNDLVGSLASANSGDSAFFLTSAEVSDEDNEDEEDIEGEQQ
jgi:hypothetical protein